MTNVGAHSLAAPGKSMGMLPGRQPPTRVHARNAAHGDTAGSHKARKRGEQSVQTVTAVRVGSEGAEAEASIWEKRLAKGQVC
jgi:hypothetical protein